MEIFSTLSTLFVLPLVMRHSLTSALKMTTNNFTILSALEQGAHTLKRAWEGVYFDSPPNAKFDAQVLLCAILHKPAAYLFAHGGDPLSEEQASVFFAAIERRSKHEPVALITGEKAFFGRDFSVTKDTLIPRPETEVLVETVLPLITPSTIVIDVGTGSGAISITLACETAAPVVATDISQHALEVAKRNALRHGVVDRISFLLGNLLLPFFPALAQWPAHFPVDHLLVCANLPYLTTHQWEALDPNVKNFEPRTALVGGYTGLELYDELLMQIKARRTLLPKNITLACEIDPAQKDKLPQVIHAHFPGAGIVILYDLARLPRLVLATL
ncbi:peptide chain release factor N(5)-glutamine methyltransferase [bacterium]|nr:peptide chain release factor N(5)-glutamine methyltransferase [bacterium]NBX48849.1 peptide chain release factor N(5)-glutamine methyltransferase [bacterium]